MPGRRKSSNYGSNFLEHHMYKHHYTCSQADTHAKIISLVDVPRYHELEAGGMTHMHLNDPRNDDILSINSV